MPAADSEERRQTLSANGRALGLRRLGDGPPILLINGFAATAEDWDPVFLTALAAGHELICVDNRGLGASEDDGKPFEINDLAADVVALVSELDLRAPTVLGWSMGGFVAQAALLMEPACAGRLVLLSTDGGGPGSVPREASVEVALTDLSGTPREQASRLLGLLFAPELAAQVDQRFGEIVAEARSHMDPAVLERQIAAMRSWAQNGASEDLAHISCPTLIATGVEDRVIPSANSMLLADQINSSWLARFPDSGHGFIAQYPLQLAALIGAFRGSGVPSPG